MAKSVYLMDMRMEASGYSYVLAESQEQAVKAFIDYLTTDDGKEYVQRKIQRASASGTVYPVVSTRALKMSDAWPLDMYDLDATGDKPKEIAS